MAISRFTIRAILRSVPWTARRQCKTLQKLQADPSLRCLLEGRQQEQDAPAYLRRMFPNTGRTGCTFAIIRGSKGKRSQKNRKGHEPLFMVDDLVGRGLPMFLPKGYTIWQELENYIKRKERKTRLSPCYDSMCRHGKSLQDIRSLGSL